MSDERVEQIGAGLDDPEREKQVGRVLARVETWSEAPSGVADQVIAAITAEARQGRADQPRSRRWAWAAVAAAVLAVVVLFVGIALDNPEQRVIAMEGTELAMSATGHAVLLERGGGWWISLEVAGLQPAGDGQYYEGWLWSDDGAGVSVGTFHLHDPAGPVILWSGVDPAAYPALWVTLEDEDGNPAASERVVMRGRTATER